MDTFKKICAPVGMELKKWSQEKGYFSLQVAAKYRNPQHKANAAEEKILKIFSSNPKLKIQKKITTYKNDVGTMIYARIDVVNSCLHCHGPQNKRPQFIVQKYAEDKAFNFKPGDLRGMYKVFIPNNSSERGSQ